MTFMRARSGQSMVEWLLGTAILVAVVGGVLLALFGTLDVQVPHDQNASAVEAAYPKADIKVFEGLNHLFQHATTGMVPEYGQIEETRNKLKPHTLISDLSRQGVYPLVHMNEDVKTR